MFGHAGAARSARLSAYPEIHHYGLIGNTRTAALISDSGSIEWCPLPRFDSPSVFASMLDRRNGGEFSITPSLAFQTDQSYIENTNVLETRFRCAKGSLRVIDTFSSTSEAIKRSGFWPPCEILRIVEGLEGEMEVDVQFDPRPRYSRGRFRIEDRAGLGLRCSWDNHLLTLIHSLPPGAFAPKRNAPGLNAHFRIKKGERRFFSLNYADESPAEIPPLEDAALDRLEKTLDYWRRWAEKCDYTGPYRANVVRSALALKLMTFSPSGAIVAAPTTSLPETIGGERNWDYRYCWLRDSSYTVRALLSLGFQNEARAFCNWMIHSTRLTRPFIQVLYSVYGGPTLPERCLNWLDGYRISRPVRIGNDAHRQQQIDIYGEVCRALAMLVPNVVRIDRETRKFLLGLGKAVVSIWREPDEGIWESRAGKAHHTHSKALACVALETLASMKDLLRDDQAIEIFRKEAASIRDLIESRGFNSKLNSYVGTLDGESLDASLLTLPLVAYCPAGSTRMVGTYRAVTHRLSRSGLIYRYRDYADGLPGSEGAFAICNLWMAESLALAGRPGEARAWLEAILSHSNATGLWSEEIDPQSGEFLGNYPQAYTHVGIINAVFAIARADRDRAGGSQSRGPGAGRSC